MKDYLAKMYGKAMIFNDRLIMKSLNTNGPFESILDVGCWDGEKTIDYAKACGAKKIYGIEVVEEASDKARKQGVQCFSLKADQDKWPFQDDSLDCIVTNQVVEHLSDLDHFFSEASRVLKRGGFLITSTNNLASWHNIFPLVFAWAPFDLTNSSKTSSGIGNPLAIHRGEQCEKATWTHKCVYTPRWLFEWQNLYALRRISHTGSGFYPFPAQWGNLFKSHAAFMILTTLKEDFVVK
jgi:SAM-dependent methyltransferase